MQIDLKKCQKLPHDQQKGVILKRSSYPCPFGISRDRMVTNVNLSRQRQEAFLGVKIYLKVSIAKSEIFASCRVQYVKSNIIQ